MQRCRLSHHQALWPCFRGRALPVLERLPCMPHEHVERKSDAAKQGNLALCARCKKKRGQWGWTNFNLKMHSSIKVRVCATILHSSWGEGGPVRLTSLDHANTGWPDSTRRTSEKKAARALGLHATGVAKYVCFLDVQLTGAMWNHPDPILIVEKW
jgi:hypothetical protein